MILLKILSREVQEQHKKLLKHFFFKLFILLFLPYITVTKNLALLEFFGRDENFFKRRQNQKAKMEQNSAYVLYMNKYLYVHV